MNKESTAASHQAPAFVSGGEERGGVLITEAPHFDPDDLNRAFRQAQLHEQAGDLASALLGYRKIVLRDPLHRPAVTNLVLGLLQVRNPQEALAVLRQIPRQAIASETQLGLLLAGVWQALGNVTAAVETLRQALLAADLTGAEGDAANVCRHRLAEALLQVGTPAAVREAEQLLAALVAESPDHVGYRYAWGNAFMATGETAEAWRQWHMAAAVADEVRPEIRLRLAEFNPQLQEPYQGRRLTLHPFSPDYLHFIQRAFVHQGFTRRMGRSWSIPGSLQGLAEQLTHYQQLPIPAKGALEWVVVDHDQAVPLGVAVLTDVDWPNSRAEFSLGLLDPSLALSNLALEAALLTLDLAFNHARLRKLVSYVYTDNPRAQTNTLSLGFSAEGIVREHLFDSSTGQWLSLFQNSLLESEFRGNQRLQRLSKRLLHRDITAVPVIPAEKPQDAPSEQQSVQ